MDKDFVENIIFGEKYYSIEDLRYSTKAGFLLSKSQLSEFMKLKDEIVENGKYIKKLPLKTFDSRSIYYVNGIYFLNVYNEYLSLAVNDYEENSMLLSDRVFDDIIVSRIFSEVEGTLNIENVQTTHKRIKEIYNGGDLKSRNDVIIKNMISAIKYIYEERPEFNKENLFKLYNILSNGCLEEDEVLAPGNYYRNGAVYIGKFEGADHNRIDELMNGLFEFVNNRENVRSLGMLLPQICHYYIVYVHPYFDYNGRTARMVSFWLNVLYGIKGAPLFISEAINENKIEYYKALINTRLAGNDLTYFLGYVMESAVKFSLVYKNVESIRTALAKEGTFLTQRELNYIKKIIVHNSDGAFNGKMFLKYINAEMSKQAYSKVLNSFAEYGVLIKFLNKKHETVYRLNPDVLAYDIKN